MVGRKSGGKLNFDRRMRQVRRRSAYGTWCRCGMHPPVSFVE